jgi:hypothetical protein
MKKIFMMLVTAFFAIYAMAQSTHTVDFETPGTGTDWDWVVVENADNPPLEFVANPDDAGINASATTAKFTARTGGNPWALCFTDDNGEFTFDATNSIVKIMVYKTTISNVGIKFEGISAPLEIVVSNTLTNQWEELTYDFSSVIGNAYSRLVIIPDFDFTPRPADHIVYFDNIQVPEGVIPAPPGEPGTVPPVPVHAEENVLSIYSDAYTNLPGTDFNPNWGQSTQVTVDYVAAENNTLRYENLNYQGTQFAVPLDVSGYDSIHIDFWTPNSTLLNFYLISPGNEIAYTLPITQETWVSIDIPLADFVPPVNLSDVIQFKVDGNGTVFFDNWYFWKTPPVPGTDATLSDLQVDGETIEGFSPAVLNYTVELPEGTTEVPVVTATTNDPEATHIVNDALSLPGTTEIVVTALNGIVTKTYTVDFTITEPAPQPKNITFRVDMAHYNGNYSNVYVSGSFNGWCGDCNMLTDPDMDGIYETTLLLDQGQQEYKFTLDNWAVQEEFEPGEPCTITTGDFTNRLLTVEEDMELIPVCWNSCDICPDYPAGWHGISSNVIPESKMPLEELFAPVVDDMVILLGKSGIFWPSQNLNTLGDWDTYQGYKVKLAEGVNFEFTGAELTDRTVTFEPGIWYVPVLSEEDASIEDVIVPLGNKIEFMFDISNSMIYWPYGGIVPGVPGALETLQTGFAYLARFNETTTVDFGTIPTKALVKPVLAGNFVKTTGWNENYQTGIQHIFSIQTSSLLAGDVIGAFDSDGICVGMASFGGNSEVIPLVVFGNDITTSAKDGMEQQEMSSFRIFRNGSDQEVTAIFDENLASHDGRFAENGLSVITDLKMGATMIDADETASFSIYPNPNNGHFSVRTATKGMVSLTIVNMQGQMVMSSQISGSATLDLSNQPKGIYFIRLSSATSTSVEKIVIE